MNGLAIFQQNDPQKLPRFRDSRPFSYSSIGLGFGLKRASHHLFYPFVSDGGPVRPMPNVLEILGCFHLWFFHRSLSRRGPMQCLDDTQNFL